VGGVREMMLGILVIAVLAGVILGRNTERARRNVKDWGTAKSAVPKGRSIAFAEVRRAAMTIIIVGGVMVALFIGVINLS
jgi:hypothetical protein